MYIQHILEEVRIDAIDRFGKKIIVYIYVQDIKVQVVRDPDPCRSRLQMRVSFILKDTYTRDPSGSIIQGLQLDRINCRGPRRQALQYVGTRGSKALLEAAQLYWKFFHTTLWKFHWIPQPRSDRQDRLDLQELLVVAVDSVAPEASIQQAGPLIRIAGNRCIGIFPYISVEFSRRIHSTGCFCIATEDLQGPTQVYLVTLTSRGSIRLY